MSNIAEILTQEPPMAQKPDEVRTSLSKLMPERLMPDSARKMLGGAANDDDLRARLFQNIVIGENDLVGYVAYSLHELNRRDWLTAFTQEFSRVPTEAEISSWLVGESTNRRLATYRRLATDALAGRAAPITPGDEHQLVPASRSAPQQEATTQRPAAPMASTEPAARPEWPAAHQWPTAKAAADRPKDRSLFIYVGGLIFVMVSAYMAVRYGLFGR